MQWAFSLAIRYKTEVGDKLNNVWICWFPNSALYCNKLIGGLFAASSLHSFSDLILSIFTWDKWIALSFYTSITLINHYITLYVSMNIQVAAVSHWNYIGKNFCGYQCYATGRNTIWNYWVSGLCPLASILKTREHNISETGSSSILRWGGRTPQLSLLERANLSHCPTEDGNGSSFRYSVFSSL
jgi:hypothetical protein